MSDPLTNAEDRLIESLAAATRGAARNGTFALWLFVRVCGGLLPPDAVSGVGHGQRVAGLARRLARLPLPPPLRRALVGALREVEAADPRGAVLALQQLVAPARESLGGDAGEAMAQAARAAGDALRAARA